MLRFKSFEELLENEGLKKKAAKSGISYGTLKKVYNRGMAAWRTGHRPGTTPQQWGMARVNSYIGKGKGTYYGADADLRGAKRKTKKEGFNEAYDKTNKATMHVKDAGVEKEDHPFIRKDVAKTGAKVKFHSGGGISYHGSDHQIAKALKQHHPDDHKELGNLNYHKSGQHDKDYGSHGSHVYTNHSAKTKKEEYGMFGKKVSDSLLKAISIVDNYTHEFDVDSEKNAHTMVKKAKAAGMKAKIHTMKGPGGGNPVVHLGHKDTNHMHKFIKKHYDDSYEKSDLNIHKM